MHEALCVDWLPQIVLPGGALGLTACPGTGGRVLSDDLDRLGALGVDRLLTLLTHDEMVLAGVASLAEEAVARGMIHRWLPIADRATPPIEAARRTVAEVRAALACGERVVVHCMAGIGRSGLFAACLLVSEGATADDAIALVRRVRDPDAVETAKQEAFVRSWAR